MPDPIAPTEAALALSDVVKSYGGKRVVDRMTFTAPRSQITAILGPNGAGKTTTIECCEGLRTADSGTIKVLGRDPHDPALREHVGVMLQDGGLPTGVRALEMLRHIASMYAHPRSVDDLVDTLGLASFASTTVRRLSGGERQRLALAAALIGRPSLVFLDEPSAGMDPQSRHAVWSLIEELRGEGVSFVLTTHMMDEAAALADHVVIVDRGRVIAQGSVPDLVGAEAATGPAVSTLRWSTEARRDFTPVFGARSTLTWTEAAPGHYTASGDIGPAVVAQLTQWCEGQDLLIRTLSVNERSLEDVFLDLTGRELR
ncbi:ABC transporter ATP-binding protein [Rarobacter incanus]|uniref:ABC-2 type transport system ATP-binding protein n=1 Tax=Rarobacter incanus TaxID=153494 RepID=A0A542SMH7_9MICO|nr:ABC transporter ATP-binding protein [Rarobacter incanus]TQK75834.1 ABC-2 type transport system ATP-binding protein [Rarobacter incanus]